MSALRASAVLAVLAAAGGCGAAPDEAAVFYYRDVKPILDAKCTACHHEGGIAPFSLTRLEEVAPRSEAIRAAVTSRRMPPWLAGPGCAEYQGDRSLSDGQIGAIARWIDDGALAGDPALEPPPLGIDELRLSRVDLDLPMLEPYTPRVSPDDYRCFVVDWPEGETRFVSGFRASPGVAAEVHHVIAFMAAPEDGAAFEALDQAEEGPGYTCFGGPGPAAGQGIRMLGGWAPGSLGTDFPAGTGLRVEPGAKVILQVHYNTLVAPAVPDVTSVQVRIEPSVEKEAAIFPWADPRWLDADGMVIPAGEPDTSYSFALDPTLFLGGRPFTIYGATIHMHLLGTSGRLAIERADGSSECMLDVPRWDFAWQNSYGFTAPKVFEPGDQLSIECHWDNSAAHQPLVDGQPLDPRDVAWGEGTTDEMCVGFFYATF